MSMRLASWLVPRLDRGFEALDALLELAELDGLADIADERREVGGLASGEVGATRAAKRK
jgi:hypothetical protein